MAAASSKSVACVNCSTSCLIQFLGVLHRGVGAKFASCVFVKTADTELFCCVCLCALLPLFTTHSPVLMTNKTVCCDALWEQLQECSFCGHVLECSFVDMCQFLNPDCWESSRLLQYSSMHSRWNQSQHRGQCQSNMNLKVMLAWSTLQP